MKNRRQIQQLFQLAQSAQGWWPVYLIGLIGVASQSLVFNYTMSLGLQGLSEAAIYKDVGILTQTLWKLGLRLLLLTAILPFFTYAFDGSVKRITGNIRKKLFHHIQRLPMEYMENRHSGDMISRLTNDIQTAENAYGWQLSLLLMSLVAGLGSVLVIITVDPRLAVAAVLIGVCNLLVNTIFIKPIRSVSEKVQQHLSDANQRLSDIIAGNQIAKIYNLSTGLTRRYMEANLGIRSSALKRTVYQSALNSLNWFVIMMSFIGMVIFGSIMIVQGQMEFHRLMLAVQMMNGIIWMFAAMGGFITQLQGSLAGATRVFEILDASVESSEGKPMDTVWEENGPVIEFDAIDFAYNGDSQVLHGFGAVVQKNETAAIVGLSGSGKSTLFKLLLGFYKPTSGSIRLFNRNIEDYTLKELRQMIAYVPQDSYLFTGSILENIAYGRLDASMEDIISATKAAYAHEFIQMLPEGYDTQVGERGARLSGGQRQRIAIARALLKDAPILLLDEATASLDSESEQQVQKALEILMMGRTTIAVAHRLSTIQHADKILVMENGGVVEEGDHHALLAINKVYAKLYNLQFQSMDPAANLI